MHDKHLSSLEHVLHGCIHSEQVLPLVKKNPSSQEEHLVAESEHVLQFESHFKH